MKESVRDYCIMAISVLLLVVAIYSATVIGDKLAQYQSFKTLDSISRLSHPIQTLIDEIQVERTLSSRFISVSDPAHLQQLQGHFSKSDAELLKFGKELKRTELLLLSIPEAELSEKTKSLKQEREKLTQKPVFYQQFVFYNRLIDGFMGFQDKMFTYADAPEFKPLIEGLIQAESLKESIAQEQAFVAFHLSPSEIKPGEIPLIIQEISNQTFQDENLKALEHEELRAEVDALYNSKEYLDLIALRKQFFVKEPNLTGSIAKGEEYMTVTSGVLRKLKVMNEGIQKKIEDYARDGRSRMKSEVIWATTFAVMAILLLIGLLVGLRNFTSTSESVQT